MKFFSPKIFANISVFLHLSLMANAQSYENYYAYDDSAFLKSATAIIEPSKDLKINEILAGNTIVNKDEFGEYDDWIELYNFGEDTINLNGLYISDSKNDLSKFQINSDVFIKPKGCILIWADGDINQGDLHANFKLDPDGEDIYISDKDLTLLDHLPFNKQSANISYGRLKNNILSLNYFTTPTPGAENPENGRLNILSPPTSSHFGGFYEETICVTLSHPDEDVKIYYTLNGDIPDNNSNQYDNCIQIESPLVLRYCAIKEGYVASPVQTASFFFNNTLQLDIVSIAGKGDALVGTNGILQSTNKELEKPIHLDYFGNDKKLKFRIDGGLRIHSPKANPQYSVRFYARSDYGKDEIKYKIFDDKDISSFKRLVFRNSGNDGTVLNSASRTHIRDGLHHILLNKMGYPETACGYRPVNVFVNGSYYGIYNLRERIDKYFIESNFGYTGEMDLLEFAFHYPGNKNPIEGSFQLYDSLIKAVINNENNAENHEILNENLNIDQYLDYCILEIHVGNYDWMVNNIKIFRPDIDGGKFNWLLWDTDHGSGLPYNDYGNVSWNTLLWALSTDQSRTEGGYQNAFLRKLLKYGPIQEQFVLRYSDLLNTTFRKENIQNTIDSIVNLLNHDMEQHLTRWNKNLSTWKSAINELKAYHLKRQGYMLNYLQEQFSLGELYELTIQVNDTNAGLIRVNSIVPDLENGVWSGNYFGKYPVEIEAIPNEGFRFDGWENETLQDNQTSKIILTSDIHLEAIFLPVDIDSSRMVINEICLNAEGEAGHDNWIEIANLCSVDMPLDRWKIVLDTDTFELDDITLMKNQYHVISDPSFDVLKNNTNLSVSLFSGFQLNNRKGQIKIINQDNTVVDMVNYGGDDWPQKIDTLSFPFELINGYIDNGQPNNWKNSTFLTGTPGIQNSRYNNFDGLVINELMGYNVSTISNEDGLFEDWIELYNSSNQSIDLSGLFISDNKDNITKYQVPPSSNPPVINPKDFVLCWADNNIGEGPLHLNFKLDNDGEELFISYNNGSDIKILDEIKFPKQFPSHSYGREVDGLEFWMYQKPSPGWDNNTILDISEEIEHDAETEMLIYPNPASDYIRIRNTEQAEHKALTVQIIDLSGKTCMLEKLESGFNKEIDIQHLEPGLYIIKVINNNELIHLGKIQIR